MIDAEREKFRRIGPTVGTERALTGQSVTYWQQAWRRLRHNRTAMVSVGVLVVIALLSLCGQLISGQDPNQQNLFQTNLPPSGQHWFGTDDLGRDLWTRVWFGARISLFIGIVAALLDLVVGVLYGGISGYLGGRVDDVMMRIVEVLYGIPFLIVTLLFVVVMRPGIWTIILAMAITGWMQMARLVRGQVLQLKEQEFVQAARVLGQSPLRVILRHLIPNTMGPILVNVTLTVPNAIFTESFLAYVGLGVPLPAASWGTLAQEGTQQFMYYPWELAFPALMICVTMLAFNLLGDGIRDAFDPRIQRN